MKKKTIKHYHENNGPAEVSFTFVEVRAEECGGDLNKMIKKFRKLVKKRDILRPVYDRMYFKSKSQKRRESKLKAIRAAKLGDK